MVAPHLTTSLCLPPAVHTRAISRRLARVRRGLRTLVSRLWTANALGGARAVQPRATTTAAATKRDARAVSPVSRSRRVLRASANRAPTIGGTMSEPAFGSRRATTTSDFDVRAADLQEEMAEHAFRSVRSDEDGGYPANIAASGSEQSNTARCASSKAQTKTWPRTPVTTMALGRR
jgi:hypothetical protein